MLKLQRYVGERLVNDRQCLILKLKDESPTDFCRSAPPQSSRRGKEVPTDLKEATIQLIQHVKDPRLGVGPGLDQSVDVF